MSNSILDQVITSQRMSAISEFDPEIIAGKLFEILNDREKDIVVKRHGLNGKPKVTLEEIGNQYSVTRERVRQVENASLKRIREKFNDDTLKEVESLIRAILEDHGHIMAEDKLIELLIAEQSSSDRNNALVRFLLNQLLKDRFSHKKEDKKVVKAWSLPNADWDRYHNTIDAIAAILDDHSEPIGLDDLLGRAKNSVDLHPEWSENADQILINYLEITKLIEENIFNEWGMAHWSSIRPRRMNDKVYLIMKKEGKPLHFTDIAKRINDAQFDQRVAYPATIHNELILDDKYVLVGRGIYALKEWGYKPGIVIDVIREILSDSNGPMTRDEIVKHVLKNRMVKKSTVVLALMNKEHFAKDDKGLYTLKA